MKESREANMGELHSVVHSDVPPKAIVLTSLSYENIQLYREVGVACSHIADFHYITDEREKGTMLVLWTQEDLDNYIEEELS